MTCSISQSFFLFEKKSFFLLSFTILYNLLFLLLFEPFFVFFLFCIMWAIFFRFCYYFTFFHNFSVHMKWLQKHTTHTVNIIMEQTCSRIKERANICVYVYAPHVFCLFWMAFCCFFCSCSFVSIFFEYFFSSVYLVRTSEFFFISIQIRVCVNLRDFIAIDSIEGTMCVDIFVCPCRLNSYSK